MFGKKGDFGVLGRRGMAPLPPKSAYESWPGGGSRAAPLNYGPSENCRLVFFLSENAKFGDENRDLG